MWFSPTCNNSEERDTKEGKRELKGLLAMTLTTMSRTAGAAGSGSLQLLSGCGSWTVGAGGRLYSWDCLGCLLVLSGAVGRLYSWAGLGWLLGWSGDVAGVRIVSVT